ncbi:MAG: hypothetical protein AB8F26_00340 [Phycisphaerales bacterium]
MSTEHPRSLGPVLWLLGLLMTLPGLLYAANMCAFCAWQTAVPQKSNGIDWGTRATSWLLVTILMLAVTGFTGWKLVVATREVWRSRRPPGSCKTCGYDLRNIPPRCPECGSEPNHP